MGASKPTRCGLEQCKHLLRRMQTRPGRRGPAPSLTSGWAEPRDSVGLPRARAATGNVKNPANRNLQLRSCRPMEGRVGVGRIGAGSRDMETEARGLLVRWLRRL